jgi:hypothetical protein
MNDAPFTPQTSPPTPVFEFSIKDGLMECSFHLMDYQFMYKHPSIPLGTNPQSENPINLWKPVFVTLAQGPIDYAKNGDCKFGGRSSKTIASASSR